MSLESASFISDLDITNPAPTDQKKQGDDHLRLIKTVLKACFPNASKAFYFPTTVAKTADFAVAASDMHKTHLVDTTAGVVTATLPTLVSGDAGWECFFLKTNTGTSPLLIAPPSGTIQSGDQAGLAKTRRCIPGVRTRVFWSGTAWYAERVVNVPVGTILDIPRGSLPVGFEFANGQTLASASTNYPDFYQSNGNSGVVTDRRGRAAFGRDTMSAVAGAAGRLGNAGGEANVDVLGTGIGGETITLTQARLPSCTFALTIAIDEHGGHFHTSGPVTNAVGFGTTQPYNNGSGSFSGWNNWGAMSSINTGTSTTGITASGTAASGGSASPFSRVPPGILTNFMVVVE